MTTEIDKALRFAEVFKKSSESFKEIAARALKEVDRLNPALTAAQARIAELEKEVVHQKADRTYMAKLLIRIRDAVLVAAEACEDEGGRVYFGNTNHADELKVVAEEFDTWDMERRIFPWSKDLDLYAINSELRDRATKAEAQLANDREVGKALMEVNVKLIKDAHAAQTLVHECSEYLKEGQTPKQRMDQDQSDILGLMELLRLEKVKNEDLKAQIARAVEMMHNAHNNRVLVDAALRGLPKGTMWDFAAESVRLFTAAFIKEIEG